MKKQISSLFLFLLVSFFSVATVTAQQQQTVKGTVTDAATGEPLIGVSVSVVGTSEGGITDVDGKYEINLASLTNVTLKFNYLGFSTVEIPLNGRQTLNVAMKESSQMISEVVVVGYGQQKRESVIASISSIDNKTLVSMPVSNVTQSLAGKLPGVQIVQSSGEVGNDEATIWIRGQGTWNNSTPLYIVDGIVRENIAQIDPNEIQSINVLKDASATAVYGVKGANGVLIITTKRGVTGEPVVSFTAHTAITEPVRVPYPLGAYQASTLKNLHKFGAYGSDDYSALDIITYRTHASPYTHPDTNWVDEILKDNSSLQQYNLNVTGGTNFLKYFISGGYMTQAGFYNYDSNTNYTRYNFRSNLDFSFSKQLSLAFNLGARVEKRTYPSVSSDNSWEVYRATFAVTGRLVPMFNPDGSLGGSDTYPDNLVGRLRDRGHIRNINTVIETSLNAKYKMDFITEGLSARAQLAFDNSGRNRTRWDKNYATYYYNLSRDTYTKIGEDTYLANSLSDREFKQNLYLEMGLEYARTFGLHSVSGLFLATRNDRLNNAEIGYAAQGLVGRVAYDYDKRYFAEVNIGYNGSENFAKGKRYGLFPAFSAGWMITNEEFIRDSSLLNFMNMLKVRASLGWVGNDKPTGTNQNDRFSYIQQYSYGGGSTFGIGDVGYTGIRMGNIANYNLTWEVARKSNIGFDSGFFNDKLMLSADYFDEYRDNILTNIGGIIPFYVGASFMPANVGIATNKGVEFDLTFRNKIGKDFNFFIKGNYSFARNKVIKKADAAGALLYQKEEGYSIGVPSIYRCIGIFQSYDEIYNSPNQMLEQGVVEVLPGDLKYLDFNNDGVIDIKDAFRQGYGTTPEIQYGITLGADYKGFDFNLLFQGSEHALFKKNWEIMYHFSNNDNVFTPHWYYWTPEMNGHEQYMRIYGAYWNNERPESGGSTYCYGNGDYYRIKSVELGYTLPRAITKKILMSSVRIYVSGNNLYTWATEPYLDPDNRDQRGGLMPPTRAFNIGVNVNF